MVLARAGAEVRLSGGRHNNISRSRGQRPQRGGWGVWLQGFVYDYDSLLSFFVGYQCNRHGADKHSATYPDIRERAFVYGVVRAVANGTCIRLASWPWGVEIQQQRSSWDRSDGVLPIIRPWPVGVGPF